MTDEERGGAPPPEPFHRRSPSVWPPFVAFVVAMAFAAALQVTLGVLVGVWYAASGRARQPGADPADLLTATPFFVAFTLAGQGALLATALVAARLAPVRLRGELGFVRPALPVWGYPVLAAGSLVPLALGTAVMEAVARVVPMDPVLERTFERVSPAGAVPFVLFLALVPGFVEEALFRGYVQRRLLARWPAWAAIGATAGLFGLMHVYPAHAAFAFALGLWLGAVAWRTGSVWPAVLCHASVNAAAGVWNLGTRFGLIPDPLPDAAAVVGAALALGCFVASVRLLMRSPAAGGVSSGAAPGPRAGDV